jgi:hypothetical protein
MRAMAGFAPRAEDSFCQRRWRTRTTRISPVNTAAIHALPGFGPLPLPTRPAHATGVGPLPTGGWYDSSLDLMLGLEVQDVDLVEWRGEWEGAATTAN